MNILHLSNVFNQSVGGGIHEVVENLLSQLTHNLVNAKVWSPKLTNKIENQNYSNDIHYVNNFDIAKHWINRPTLSSKNSFDIIHQHGIWLPTSKISINFSKMGKPVFIQPHGLLEQYRINKSKVKKQIAYHLFEKENIRASMALIACSGKEAKNLKMMFPSKDVAIIPIGISNFYLKNFVHCQLNTPSSDQKEILFLSQIIPVKGLERLFKILSIISDQLLKDWTVIIAGYGREKYIKYLKILATQLNIDDYIKFIGPVYESDKIKLLDSSDFFILPSFSENFGIVIAEALARGLPVLTTAGTPWEALNKYKCGLCVGNDIESIQAGLEYMLNQSDSERKDWSINGKKLIKSKYLWDSIINQYLTLYRWGLGVERKPQFVI